MANLHKIKAQLYDNVLTPNPNDFMARVISERSLSVKEICLAATTRGGADISAAAMEHAVDLYHKEMGYSLCDGFSVNTGWYTASVSIKGVFDSPTEKFNAAKHTVMFDFKQGSLLRKELGAVTVDITGVADTSAYIAQVTDVKTGSINDLLTPNRNLRINGSKIKIAGNNTANGVYFVNPDTHERTRVDDTDMVTNNPSELVIVIPALAAGTYRLEVTTQYTTGGNLLKEPKTASFDRTLTVS
jgi:hypothetical protein